MYKYVLTESNDKVDNVRTNSYHRLDISVLRLRGSEITLSRWFL